MRTNLILVTIVAAAAGCSGGTPQTITGRVAPGFPDTIQSIEVVRGTSVVASSRVAVDGSFRLSVPASAGLQLRLIGSGHSNVVMPRTGGTLDRTFRILPGGRPFDLGGIFHVGNASTTRFALDQGAGSGSGSGSGSAASCDAEDHDQSGATCVDDAPDGNQCAAETDNEAEVGDAETGSGSGSGTADGPDDGDAVPEHDFPAGGCAGDD